MTFSQVKKISSVWGQSEPSQLLKISEFFNSRGFVGPTIDSDPYFFIFRRVVDKDFTFSCTVRRLFENPKKVFHFGTALTLWSRSVRVMEVEKAVNMDEPPPLNASGLGGSVFSIDLAHLKWNFVGGQDNPTWQVSALAGYEFSIQKWVDDWIEYLEPISNSVHNLDSAIECCKKALAYRRQPWVKSDGFIGPNFEINTAALLVQAGRIAEANRLLEDAIALSPRAARQHQIRLALNWVNSI